MSDRLAPPTQLPGQLVLFDGTCALCDGAVRWIVDHDPQQRFHFAPLQGSTARAILARHPEVPATLDSLVLVTQGSNGERLQWESRGIFAICARLKGPVRWLGVLGHLPRWLTDPAYRLVARLRYRLFGRLESCRIPDPSQAHRFLA